MPIIVLPELATTVPVLPGESLLNALITAKINAPYDCMAGHCGECRAQVLAGRANPLYAGDEVQSLSPADRDKGYLLLCQSVINPADESISIALSPQKKPTMSRMALVSPTVSRHAIPAKIAAIKSLSSEVIGLSIALPEQPPFVFNAGQYVDITFLKISRTDSRAYSIASAPHTALAERTLSFHIRLNSGGFFAKNLASMAVGDVLRVSAPKGNFGWHEHVGERPIVLLAGGTGFAPIQALMESLGHYAKNDPILADTPIWLYWGVRSASEVYAPESLIAWQDKFSRLAIRLIPSEDETPPESPILKNWWQKKQLAHSAVGEEWKKMERLVVYASGAPAMVHAAFEAFRTQGLLPERFYSDSFTPAQPAVKPPPSISSC